MDLLSFLLAPIIVLLGICAVINIICLTYYVVHKVFTWKINDKIGDIIDILLYPAYWALQHVEEEKKE